jgi:hypothetical protein
MKVYGNTSLLLALPTKENLEWVQKLRTSQAERHSLKLPSQICDIKLRELPLERVEINIHIRLAEKSANSKKTLATHSRHSPPAPKGHTEQTAAERYVYAYMCGRHMMMPADSSSRERQMMLGTHDSHTCTAGNAQKIYTHKNTTQAQQHREIEKIIIKEGRKLCE